MSSERKDGARFAPSSSSNARAIVYIVENRIGDGETIVGQELERYKISNNWLQEMHAATARTELVTGLGLNVTARLIGNKAFRRLTHLAGAALLADSTRNFLESEIRKGIREMIVGKDKLQIIDLSTQVPSYSE